MLRNIAVVVSSAVVALLLVAAGWAAGGFFAEQEHKACRFHDYPLDMFSLGLDMEQSGMASELGRLFEADVRERCPASVCAGSAMSLRERKLVLYVKGGADALPEDFGQRAKDLGSEVRVVAVRFSAEELQAAISQIQQVQDARILSVAADTRANGIVIGLADYDPLNTVLLHPLDILSVEARTVLEQVMATGVPIEFLPADEEHLPQW